MAENKQLEYNYIRNTLNRTTTKQYDGSLGVGVSVTNLTVPLDDNYIINPNYLELYEDKSLSESWKVGQELQTITISQDHVATDSEEKYITGGQIVRGTTFGVLENITRAALEYTVSGKITVPDNTRNVTITSPHTATLRDNTVTYVLKGIRPNQTITASISYEYLDTVYTHTSSYNVPSNLSSSDIKVTTSTGTVTYSKDVGKETLTVTYSGTSPNHRITISYPGPVSEVDQSDTLNYGVLQHQVRLEPNTTYVLQIVGACPPPGTTLPKSKVTNKSFSPTTESTWEFDQYLFFKTKNDIYQDFVITAYGVSFGYSVYGVLETNGEIKQLRCIESPVEAKVFLFKSDMPWMVDRGGVITGLSNAQLQILESQQNNGFTGSLSYKEIAKIFSKAPQIIVEDEKTIKVLFPDSNETKWKWETLVKQTKNSDYDTLNGVDLIVCRNFLTSANREYNDSTYYVNHARLCGIQKTKTSKKDEYSTGYLINDFKIKLLFNYINIDWSQGGTGKIFEWDTRDIVTKQNCNTPFSLPLASLCGYNKKYSEEKGFADDLSFKYTSISFAWGDQQSGFYSDLSIPILIDRSVIYKWEVDNQDGDKIFTLSVRDCNIVKKTDEEYYNGEAIYIDLAE